MRNTTLNKGLMAKQEFASLISGIWELSKQKEPLKDCKLERKNLNIVMQSIVQSTVLSTSYIAPDVNLTAALGGCTSVGPVLQMKNLSNIQDYTAST